MEMVFRAAPAVGRQFSSMGKDAARWSRVDGHDRSRYYGPAAHSSRRVRRIVGPSTSGEGDREVRWYDPLRTTMWNNSPSTA